MQGNMFFFLKKKTLLLEQLYGQIACIRLHGHTITLNTYENLIYIQTRQWQQTRSQMSPPKLKLFFHIKREWLSRKSLDAIC